MSMGSSQRSRSALDLEQPGLPPGCTGDPHPPVVGEGRQAALAHERLGDDLVRGRTQRRAEDRRGYPLAPLGGQERPTSSPGSPGAQSFSWRTSRTDVSAVVMPSTLRNAPGVGSTEFVGGGRGGDPALP